MSRLNCYCSIASSPSKDYVEYLFVLKVTNFIISISENKSLLFW